MSLALNEKSTENRFIAIRFNTQKFLIPLENVLTLGNLKSTLVLLGVSEQKFVRSKVAIYEDNGSEGSLILQNPIILKQFWSKIVCSNLRIVITDDHYLVRLNNELRHREMSVIW